MKNGRKIIVGVTGASGSLYARLLLEKLAESEALSEIALIVSPSGEAVCGYERTTLPGPGTEARIRCYAPTDLFAPPASGSAGYDAMVVIPCSMGTVGRIASGVSDNLLTRSADVMLKEGRKLIIVPRETPFSLIHLRNLTTLAEAGATLLPASPSFYSRPETVEQLCMTVVERVVSQLGIESEHYRWGEGR